MIIINSTLDSYTLDLSVVRSRNQLCISWWYIHQSFTARKVEEDMTSTYLQFMRGLLGTTTVFNHCRIQDKIASRIQLDATDDRYSYQELFSLTSVKEA
ncbi:uncharacterized protein LOC129887426 isoform X2 [Solanum dulcamara]|uniref:uncharacterized protein LOC129887426 isoform X2 n=1 Tax=Solanum dulcamara TaxID=45834 RepID=UPI00248601A4|nr:uncharacterized protein LOC129887426 isoform X2 [Solanum dulcamara]